MNKKLTQSGALCASMHALHIINENEIRKKANILLLQSFISEKDKYPTMNTPMVKICKKNK